MYRTSIFDFLVEQKEWAKLEKNAMTRLYYLDTYFRYKNRLEKWFQIDAGSAL